MSLPPSNQDDLRLPRPPGVVRQFWARHPRLADALIALFWGLPALLITVATLLPTGGRAATLGPWGALIGALAITGASVGFFVRRTRPILAVCLLAIALLPSVFTAQSPGQLLPVFGIYSLAVYRSNATAWIGAAALELGSTLYAWAAWPGLQEHTLARSPLQWAAVLAIELLVALLLGTTVGGRKRYLAALIDRAHQLARERDQQAQLSAAAERARIAREMHDVVSHSLTVMVTLAEGSAFSAEADPRRAADAMRQVAETGRAALSDMRRMLGVLGGDGEAALAPQPTAAELPALAERFRDLGLPVTLRVDGELAPDPAVQLAVHRVVQESLTNALRYAHGPTEVAVRIDADGDPVVITVEDDGLPGIPTPSVGAGRGIIGMAERVAALGGSLAAGPRDGRGWRVSAVLPGARGTARAAQKEEV
ncbi:sensor histidine kinase [Gryllotalpicola ginsengisoli]|uniref:sensor histidine kinase n=1 Tax=Gryllotalpicola ginsengisoli TaxID=444608 RepID=UPI0003B3EB09|nr:histidine kinase [Gryllotalpicola ginsengisoli]